MFMLERLLERIGVSLGVLFTISVFGWPIPGLIEPPIFLPVPPGATTHSLALGPSLWLSAAIPLMLVWGLVVAAATILRGIRYLRSPQRQSL